MMKKIEVFKESKFGEKSISNFLVHDSPFMKVINFNFRAGQELPIHSHQLDGEVSIAVLEGKGQFLAAEDKTLAAAPGDVLVCDIAVPHGIRAETDMRVLVTIAPPI